MVEEISDSRSMVPLISLMAPTDSWVAAWMPVICWPISPVALAVCSASALTSEATTAKPRPASPARAASMVALSASRLVWPAMVLISSTTSPMRAGGLRQFADAVVGLAGLVDRFAGHPCRFLHLAADLVDREAISSVAEATDCTLVEASSEAAATAVVSSCERSAVEVSVPAEASSCGRSRGHGLDDLADHRFEVAGDAVDPAAALDLGFGIARGGLVGGLLGDQRLLEHLQRIRHGADFGLLAPMRHLARPTRHGRAPASAARSRQCRARRREPGRSRPRRRRRWPRRG